MTYAERQSLDLTVLSVSAELRTTKNLDSIGHKTRMVVAHTGLEPVVSALRGQRVSRLHQCAAADSHYRFAGER